MSSFKGEGKNGAAAPVVGDGATRIPVTRNEKIAFGIALVCSIAGQATQNICLPLALSTNPDMGVLLTYTAFIYVLFFTLLDVLLDAVLSQKEYVTLEMNHRHLIVVGFENAMNGVGFVFGGSSSRTPLTLQMILALVGNLMAPFYKVLRHRGLSRFLPTLRDVGKRGWMWYGSAACCYLVAMALVLSDKLSHNSGENKLSGYTLFFLFGVFFAMMYNVDQDGVMNATVTYAGHNPQPLHHDHLTVLQRVKRDVMVLRSQITWMFVFTWIGTGLSLGGASQTGDLTREIFEESWASFLPFGNKYMNLFNIGYIVTFFGNIYLNRFDSAFTMIINNIAAVSSMWTGWVPSIMQQTVGFKPSVPLTVAAMLLSLVAVIPSWRFSQFFKHAVDDNAAESAPLIDDDEGSLNTLAYGRPHGV